MDFSEVLQLQKYHVTINPYPAKVNNFNFQPLEVVSRYRDPQLQVAENYCYLFTLTPNMWNLDV